MTRAALDDTSPEAARVQIELLRRFTPSQRFRACMKISAAMIGLSRRALRRARPGLSEADLLVEWAALNYGPELAAAFGRRVRDLG